MHVLHPFHRPYLDTQNEEYVYLRKRIGKSLFTNVFRSGSTFKVFIPQGLYEDGCTA